MSKFNLEFIKEQVSNSIFNRGLIMYKNNSIKLINKKINNNAKNQSLIIECEVLSSQSQEEYEVNLYFDFYDGDINFTNKYCDCMYFQINNATCKHIIASLIYCYHKSSNQFLIWSGLENEHKNLISFFKNQEKQKAEEIIRKMAEQRAADIRERDRQRREAIEKTEREEREKKKKKLVKNKTNLLQVVVDFKLKSYQKW